MYELREFLSRKVAGVPVGVIIAVASAGLLYFAVRMSPSTDDAETVTTDDTEDAPAGDGDYYGAGDNPTFEASPTTATVVAVATEDTNELWGRRVRDYLVTIGVKVADAERSVDKYLAGTPLTSQERSWIDTGIRQYGFPPENVAWTDLENPSTGNDGEPTGNAGSGVTPPTKQGIPPLRHTIKNTRDNGAGELARLYYGSNAAAKVNRLEAANLDIGPGPWKVGTKVKIPKDNDPEYFKATSAANGAGEIARKNGTTADRIKALNPRLDFPVKPGTRVRVR